MSLKSTKTALMVALAVGLVAGSLALPAEARGGGFAQRHPRRAEVLGRDRNLNRSIYNDRGRLGGNFGQLERQDQSIRRQEQADARQNGGYITRGEQHQLNQEENQLHQQVRQDYTGRGSGFGGGEGFGRHSGFGGNGGLGQGGYHFGDKFEDNHPRRSEVLGRDNRLNWNLNKDKGHLDGQYGSLEQQQRSIRQQEQADARANGGYITKQEQQQFNQQENQLHQEINQDYNAK